MKSYGELEIYKESKRLAIEVHKMSLTLPKFELFEEGGQILRSSKSVTAMIVEGKKINKFIQWVEENWNKIPDNSTGNQKLAT